MIKIKGPDPTAKDTMIIALNIRMNIKPKEAGVRQHCKRIEMIMKHVELLPGNRQEQLTTEEKKGIILANFPGLKGVSVLGLTLTLIITKPKASAKKNTFCDRIKEHGLSGKVDQHDSSSQESRTHSINVPLEG